MDSQIRQDVTALVKTIAKLDHLELDETSMVSKIKGWDSMKQVMLIVEIEKKYGIKFTSKEVISIRQHSDLENMILKKRNQGL